MSGSERPDFNDALAVGRAFDLTLPDSHAVRDAYAQAEAESPPWLFNHVVRSWLYGAKLTQHRALFPDAELVAVAVLLHDLGLARGGAPDRRFEVLGADTGRAFALSHDMGERRAEVIWDSIALHTTASIAQHKGTDVDRNGAAHTLCGAGIRLRRTGPFAYGRAAPLCGCALLRPERQGLEPGRAHRRPSRARDVFEPGPQLPGRAPYCLRQGCRQDH